MNNKQTFWLTTAIILGTSLLALVINLHTGDDFVWSYMIPIAVAQAAAINASRAKQKEQEANE